ncbi:MAG: MFS transporter [Alphaproteobacteria bacterium]|nr:MFS transporter [Alphaproteobacteria bacterium]
MAMGNAKTGRVAWLGEFDRYQWTVFLIAWIGWALDATDFGLFSLVLRPAVTELLGGQATLAEIGRVGGYLSMVGLLGWAFGGFLFGIIADYIGRVRALAISIVVFSVFTACQGLAETPLQLGIFRFLAGIGTGAEIVVGIPLVAEAFAETHRAKVLGVMMTGGAFGSIIGGQVYNLVGPYGWRYVFFVGVAPALLLLFIRRSMGEPAHFHAVRARREAVKSAGPAASEQDKQFMRFVPVQLFSRELRFNTFVGLLFCLGTLLSIWTSNIWLPTIQSVMLQKDGITGNAAIPYIGTGMMLWGIGGMLGYASFGFLADHFGRKPTIVFYNVGAIASGLVLFLGLQTYAYYHYVLVVFGFFVFGVFSGHAIYLPELFPTHVRATAVAFCNGTGRVITSFGPLVAGLLVVPFGSFNNAAAFMTCFAVLSIIAMMIGRETRDDALPK